jgi:hypothetical protein
MRIAWLKKLTQSHTGCRLKFLSAPPANARVSAFAGLFCAIRGGRFWQPVDPSDSTPAPMANRICCSLVEDGGILWRIGVADTWRRTVMTAADAPALVREVPRTGITHMKQTRGVCQPSVQLGSRPVLSTRLFLDNLDGAGHFPQQRWPLK